jgi:hypothetical protein
MWMASRRDNSAQGPSAPAAIAEAHAALPPTVRLGYEPPPAELIYEFAPPGRWIKPRTAIALCLAEHVVVIPLILLMPRGGGLEAILCGLSSLGYWIGVIGILIERRRRLTSSDLAYITTAFPFLVVLGNLFLSCVL